MSEGNGQQVKAPNTAIRRWKVSPPASSIAIWATIATAVAMVAIVALSTVFEFSRSDASPREQVLSLTLSCVAGLLGLGTIAFALVSRRHQYEAVLEVHAAARALLPELDQPTKNLRPGAPLPPSSVDSFNDAVSLLERLGAWSELAQLETERKSSHG